MTGRFSMHDEPDQTNPTSQASLSIITHISMYTFYRVHREFSKTEEREVYIERKKNERWNDTETTT